MQTQRIASERFLAGGGAMGALIRETDWSKTSVGPVETWPQNLRTAVRIMLDAPFPMQIAWGDDFIQLYNDGYRPVLGETKHPAAMGAPIKDSFPEIWDDFLGPKFADVQRGIPYAAEDLLVILNRKGYLEECYFTFSYSPLRDEYDTVQGVVTMETETTDRFIRERRLKTLRDTATEFATTNTDREQVIDLLRAVLSQNAYDVPFAAYCPVDMDSVDTHLAPLIPLVGPDLTGDTEVTAQSAASALTQSLAAVARTGKPELIKNASSLLGQLKGGVWSEPLHEVYILPVHQTGKEQPFGVLLFGVNPRKAFDADQQQFFESLTQHTTNAFAAVAFLEDERIRTQTQLTLERAEADILSRANEQMRSLFRQAPVAIGILRGPHFIVDLANPGMCQIWNRTEDQLLHKPVFEVLTETAGQGFDKLLAGVMQTGIPFIGNEIPVPLTRNGQTTIVPVNFIYQPSYEPDGTISSIIIVATEVTESVLARKKVEESEARFRQLADSMPQMVWTAQPDGNLDYYNKQWYDYTGFEEGYGDQSWTPILHPDDVDKCLTTWYNSVRTGEPYQIEYRFADRHNPGHHRWFLGRAIPIRDQTGGPDDGTITKWFGTCTDIDDQKRVSELLETRVAERTQALSIANANLERSNFDLMQFASVASHDLKEPLRKIQMFGNMLSVSAKEKLNGDERDYFQRMINASSRMQSLVDDVLNLSKLSTQSLFYADTDLNSVVSHIIDDLEINIREKSAVITVGPLGIIEANTGQIHQLLQNLISNALKFNQKPAPTVLIKQVPISPQEASEWNISTDEYISIQIQDNGIGFDETYREKIFGLFQRLHGAKYGGTGIGLSICKKIVDNHHGFIRADGRLNVGATFTVTLPIKQS